MHSNIHNLTGTIDSLNLREIIHQLMLAIVLDWKHYMLTRRCGVKEKLMFAKGGEPPQGPYFSIKWQLPHVKRDVLFQHRFQHYLLVPMFVFLKIRNWYVSYFEGCSDANLTFLDNSCVVIFSLLFFVESV